MKICKYLPIIFKVQLPNRKSKIHFLLFFNATKFFVDMDKGKFFFNRMHSPLTQA